MKSVTADALAQAYESEVMVPSKAFSPAIFERNDTRFVTEPHGFARSADGGGVHSSGDWLAPRERPLASSRDRFKTRAQARHGRDRFQARAPQRSQGRGGTKPLNLLQLMQDSDIGLNDNS